MAAALPLPLRATAGFYRYTHFLPPDGEAIIVGVSQRLLLPITARESKKRANKTKKKTTHPVRSSPSPTSPSPLERARTLARPPPRPNPSGRPGSRPRATCPRETLRPPQSSSPFPPPWALRSFIALLLSCRSGSAHWRPPAGPPVGCGCGGLWYVGRM